MGLPWFGPAALALIFIAILGTLVSTMHQRALEYQHDDLIADMQTAEYAIGLRLQADRQYLSLLAEQMPQGVLDEPTFQERASKYIINHPEIIAIGYAEDGRIQSVAPGALHANLIGYRLRIDGPSDTDVFQTLIGGMVGFKMLVPVDKHDPSTRLFVGIYSAERVLRDALPREILQQYRVGLQKSDGSVIFRLPHLGRTDPRLVRSAPIEPLGEGTVLELQRYGAGVFGMGINMLIIVSVGLATGMACGMWALNRQIARRHEIERELRQTNDKLEHRVEERTSELREVNLKLEAEIVERQLAEARDRQHQQQLAQVDRLSSMGEMAAGLAHELNQPLGAIAAFGQAATRLIDRNIAEVPELRGVLRDICDQAQRAGKIVHRLRNFVADDTPEKKPEAIGTLIQDVLELIGVELRHHQIQVEVAPMDHLPPVMVDAIQIQQVIVNLVSNAADAMANEAPGDRRVRVWAEAEGDCSVRVAVSDNGAPGDQSQLDTMFEPFITTKKQGMGMGLSICRSIVEAHGGRMWAVRNAERGLTIFFVLNAVQESHHDTASA